MLDEYLNNLPTAEPPMSGPRSGRAGRAHQVPGEAAARGRYKGFKLGAYVFREQIGQGGMGAVYLAEHETLRRKVALKVLTLPKDGNAALSVERFLREARAAAALDHPNIVRFTTSASSGETHYLVMEYVEGETLDQIARPRAGRSPRRGRSSTSPRPPPGCSTPTRRGSSTATSSPPT